MTPQAKTKHKQKQKHTRARWFQRAMCRRTGEEQLKPILITIGAPVPLPLDGGVGQARSASPSPSTRPSVFIHKKTLRPEKCPQRPERGYRERRVMTTQ